MLEKIMSLHVLLYAMISIGAFGAIIMLATNLTYRRSIQSTKTIRSLKEKWLSLWNTRDKLLHRMNRLVWYPALTSTALLLVALYLESKGNFDDGLPMMYLYVGTAVPVGLMLMRHALDFSYMETLITGSLADYVEELGHWAETVPEVKKKDPVLQEEVVDRITSSIRQTAATGSHFSRMLSEEEEEIMREIIREFME